MKILFYINTLEHGGAERVLANLANQFNDNKYCVVFVTSFPVNEEYVLNSSIVRYNLEDKEVLTGALKRNVNRIKKLINVVKRECPDIIVSFLPEPNFRSIIVSKICNIPCVVSVRNDPNQEYKLKSHYLAQKILYPLSSGIVFQTLDAKNWFNKKIRDKSTIIMNQVNPKFYNVEHLSDSYYVAVGRLTSQKNFSLLIYAFANFLKKHSNAILRIYGNGNEEIELNQLIHNLHVENNIFLMGQSNDISKELAYAKALIMSSDYEGMPNVLLEAMASGVPVISTDCPCGGPKMLIKNMETGLLVPVRDKDALSNSLIFFEEHEELQNSIKMNLRKEALKFRPEHIFSKWEEYLTFVCDNYKK